MRIIFTKHALEQIKIRKIDKIEIISTLNNPDKIVNDKFGNYIAQKTFENYLLRVFYLSEGNTMKIITSYKTLKYQKYL